MLFSTAENIVRRVTPKMKIEQDSWKNYLRSPRALPVHSLTSLLLPQPLFDPSFFIFQKSRITIFSPQNWISPEIWAFASRKINTNTCEKGVGASERATRKTSSYGNSNGTTHLALRLLQCGCFVQLNLKLNVSAEVLNIFGHFRHFAKSEEIKFSSELALGRSAANTCASVFSLYHYNWGV